MQAAVGYNAPYGGQPLGGLPPTRDERLGAPGGGVPPTIDEGARGFAGQAPGFVGSARVGGAASTVQEDPSAVRAAVGGIGGPKTVLHEEVARPLAGWLVAIRSRETPLYREIPLFKGNNTLGRDEALGAQQLLDREASAQHVFVRVVGGTFTLTDQSANGTDVNSKRVQVATLAKGDRVRMGKTTYVFVPLPAGQD